MNQTSLLALYGALLLLGSSCGVTQGPQVTSSTPTTTSGGNTPVASPPARGGNSAILSELRASNAPLQALIAETLPHFSQHTYTDPKSGRTLHYNLFVPEGYTPQERYPLVLFIADASTTGGEVTRDLTQGFGGLIWASKAEQDKHPSFVLVPHYNEQAVDDTFATSADVPLTIDLVRHLLQTYSIDTSRVYKTGQSRGGMMSMHYGITDPDLFAASLYVGCQWDTSRMASFAQQKFTYIVGAGDEKAPKGMEALRQVLLGQGAKIAEGRWSARLPESEQSRLAQEVYAQGSNCNYIIFDLGTVLPEGMTNTRMEHMMSFDYAYRIEAVRDWLFAQRKP